MIKSKSGQVSVIWQALFCAIVLFLAESSVAAPSWTYPVTRRDSSSDTIFGHTIADPYRWLEHDLRTDPEVRDWVERQNALTGAELRSLPQRAEIHRRLTDVWNFEKLTAPRVAGKRKFFERNSGLQNQSVIFVKDDGKPARPLVDPNILSPTGSVVVHDWMPTPAGDQLLYARQDNGSDSRQLHVVDAATGADTDLKLAGIRTPTFDWAADGSGIYYARYADATEGGTAAGLAPSIFFHRLGTSQNDDKMLFEGPASGQLIIWPYATSDGHWIVVETSSTDGTRADITLLDLTRPGAPPRQLETGLKGSWHFIGSARGNLLFVTTAASPLGRVVALDPLGAVDQDPKLVAPQAQAPIQQAILAGDEVVVRYLDGITSRLHRFALDGTDRGAVELPPLVVAGQMQGRLGDPTVFFTLSSMIMAPTVYSLDMKTGQMSIIDAPKATWRPRDYIVRETFAKSKDGTRVPITLAYKRDLPLGKPQPTILMVYGGWGLSVDVGFYESRFAWMDLGGVFAIAHIRGGGEFGEAWHQAAIKVGHLKGIEDFVASAEQLDSEHVTTPSQTIAYGSSNGGMMVAATINKRPDLFGTAIPRVPVTDLVRYPLFTSGKTWISEMGDPSNPSEFKGILLWSPLHNIMPGKRYPAILVTTADSDDRVVPMHSFKYVATLQATSIGERPHLLRIDRDAGHGEGKSTGQLIEEFTDLWSFASQQSGLVIKK